MADELRLPVDELDALATGETIVAITDRHEVDLNDELDLLAPDGTDGGVTGLVVGLQPARSVAGRDGDAVLLRVLDRGRPVLDDPTFQNRLEEVQAQWK
ncbi:MAG: hypothetical protein HKN74_07670 [Acidimicrobiia bacterium]|nr:hypothetical protein [Acidimicrobiia bacterium]